MISMKRCDMVAPKHFLKELHRVNKDLFVRWNWISQRWEIWEKGLRGRNSIVITVQYEDGSYRPLDKRAIDKILSFDIYRIFGTSDPIKVAYRMNKMLDEKNARAEANKRKKEHNEIVDLTKDIYPQMMGIKTVSSGWENKKCSTTEQHSKT